MFTLCRTESGQRAINSSYTSEHDSDAFEGRREPEALERLWAAALLTFLRDASTQSSQRPPDESHRMKV